MTRRRPRRQCKVFLVGEGPSDIGDLAYLSQYRDRQEGFLQPLLRTLAGLETALAFDGRKMATLPRDPVRGTGRLRATKAAQALALAQQSGAAVLVFTRDLDREQGKRGISHIRCRRAEARPVSRKHVLEE
jgi:hypothetical protein